MKAILITTQALQRTIRPRNPAQHAYLDLLERRDPAIVVATGPAGVAKTYLGAAVGMQKLLNNDVKRLVITRPAVSVDEDHGFLPGTLEDKMEPWMRPLYDVFGGYISGSKMQGMLVNRQIEICPLAYMRGRTFDDAYIIADEMQNSTPKQMQMVLTRLGKNSKIVVTGDPAQFDRGYEDNGLTDILWRIAKRGEGGCRSVGVVTFSEEDVERHPAVKDILKMYSSS